MKIAMSLPKEDFFLLERLKGKLRLSRSRLIQQAIRYWLDSYKQNRLIHKYESGYRKKPEKSSYVRAIEKAEYETFSDEGWE